MFVVRRAKPEDVDTLLKLAKMVHFINLPADREIIAEKIAWSRQCFVAAAGVEAPPVHALVTRRARTSDDGTGVLAAGLRSLTGQSPLFMFVMEETESRGVIGTCQVISKMGGPGMPNVSLQLARRQMFSHSLQVGATHTVAKLHLDESSPTEVGGLILQPSFRGHKKKLGRLLSMVRFHFMGLNREMFSDHVLAEMMGPITPDGRSPFWEHCTRCFINMTYDEADRFCQQSKEFLLTLFPREEIYLTLVAPEARAVVGAVGSETAPARAMLEKLGFRYHMRVDPFDGGPHLEAQTDDISLVRQTDAAALGATVAEGDAEGLARLGVRGIVSFMPEDGDFRAVETEYALDRGGRIVLPLRAAQLIGAAAGAQLGYTPLSAAAGPPPAPAKPKPAAKGKPTRRSKAGG